MSTTQIQRFVGTPLPCLTLRHPLPPPVYLENPQAAEVAEWRRLLMVAVAVTAPVLIIHAMDKKAE